MRANAAPPSIVSLLAGLSKADIFARPSSAVMVGARRLEAEFYGSEGYRALRAMENSGFRVQKIVKAAQVTWPGIFSRKYVEDPDFGVPFISSSGMLHARLEKRSYLSRNLTPQLGHLMAVEGTILVSRSGTIGSVALCSKDFEGFAISDDAIRVIPVHEIDRGVIYVFLFSQLGQFLLTRQKSGSVIEHLYTENIEHLGIPILPMQLRQRLSECIQLASELRTKANELMDEAEASVQTECALPSVQEHVTALRRNELTRVKTFVCSSADRLNAFGGFGAARLDATYHDPAAVALAKSILSRKDGTTLDKVLMGVRNSTLRKRNYVDDPTDGVPMLGGKQICQWRPSDVKYLSKSLTRNLNNEVVNAGWTLVSCGGTLGRTLFVHRNLEGTAVSQHVMRLIPDKSKIWPGFLFAYLTSYWGQIQLMQRGYGSVIPELRDFQFSSIAIVKPADKGKRIHDLVVAAYDARAEAKEAEDEAVSLFMLAIERGREATEQHWGRDY